MLTDSDAEGRGVGVLPEEVWSAIDLTQLTGLIVSTANV